MRRTAALNPHVAPEDARPAVRAARTADLSFITALQARFSNQLGFLPRTALAEYVDAGRVTLVFDNDTAAGYLLGRRLLRSVPAVAPLIQTAICYDAQRRTLGLQLVEHAAATAQADGRSVLQAWCRADIPANAFWQAAGFIPIARRVTANARRQPLILWRRLLSMDGESSFLRVPSRAGCHGESVTNGQLLSPRQLTAILRPAA